MELTPSQRQSLLDLAYHTIDVYVTSCQVPGAQPDDPALTQCAGAFVTLTRGGELRGCIGHVQADQPLYRVVQQMAISAAVNDPRFYPLTSDELDGLEVEISVLSPMERVTDVAQIEVGKHGLMIEQRGRRGLLLPQVATERNWDRDTFLDALCDKANLPPGSWRRGAILQSFTALVFSAGHSPSGHEREAGAA
jgi:uncharacterized protein